MSASEASKRERLRMQVRIMKHEVAKRLRMQVRSMKPEEAKLLRKTNGSKMRKFGAIVTQTALKGLNLAQTDSFDHFLI